MVAMAGAARQRIIDAAIGLFAEHGYAATSMRDLATHLHIKAGSLYTHFASKEEILTAGVAPVLDWIDDLLTRPPTSPPAVRDWLSAYLEALCRHPDVVRILAAELAVSPHSRVGQRLRDQDARVRRMLGGFAVDDVHAAASLGILWWPLLCRPQLPTTAEAAALVESALTVGPIPARAAVAASRARR